MSRLSIVHWNDVYRVTAQGISPIDGTSDVTRFAALLDDIRHNWSVRSDGARDGLSLFSGDLFSPSVESTITRGSHMVPVINELAPDVALTGNHEFDFGYPHLSKLIDATNFPWLLSNIVDENTGTIPESLHLFQVLERTGVRIGVIGLVEEDWINLVSEWPPNFKYKDMAETGRVLSQRLRGEHQCDLIIALTHARLPNDIRLAQDLFALSPPAQSARLVADQHGVDIILGGHDHFYFASKGVTTWEGRNTSESNLGCEGDNGDILVVKSGTDFKELSELTLELEDAPPGKVRKKVIKAIHGKRHEIRPDMPSSRRMQKILDDVLPSISEALKAPICVTRVELDMRSQFLRTKETAETNWFADVLRHAYDDALYAKCGSGADGVLICAGTFRGDSLYAAGEITLGHILEILPFDDPVVVLELDGKSLWDAIEAGLSKYPAKEGGFPVVSGLRVSWDSRRPPGQRVLGIWLVRETPTAAATLQFISRETSGRKYKILTREYIATGHCGYTTLPGHEYLVGPDQGQPMSGIVREYLLGARYVGDSAQLCEKKSGTDSRCREASDVVACFASRCRFRWPGFAHRLQRAIANAPQKLRARAQAHLGQAVREQPADAVTRHDGNKIRKGSGGNDNKNGYDLEMTCRGDLYVINPVLDGRFRDISKN